MTQLANFVFDRCLWTRVFCHLELLRVHKLLRVHLLLHALEVRRLRSDRVLMIKFISARSLNVFFRCFHSFLNNCISNLVELIIVFRFWSFLIRCFVFVNLKLLQAILATIFKFWDWGAQLAYAASVETEAFPLQLIGLGNLFLFIWIFEEDLLVLLHDYDFLCVSFAILIRRQLKSLAPLILSSLFSFYQLTSFPLLKLLCLNHLIIEHLDRLGQIVDLNNFESPGWRVCSWIERNRCFLPFRTNIAKCGISPVITLLNVVVA